MLELVDSYLEALRSLATGLVAALLFIGMLGLGRLLTRPWALGRRLRTPQLVLYGYVTCVLVAAASKVWFPSAFRIFYLISIVVLTLGLVLTASVAVFDVFLGTYRQVHVPAILRDVILVAVYTITVILALSNAGVNVSSMIATSAVLTAIVGFALQDLLASLMSGLALQIEKPFEPGHWVRFGEQEGRVLEVNWRTTKIETLFHDVVVIPNNVVTKTSIINFSVPDPVHRRKASIGLRYEAPPNLVKRSILRAVSQVEGVLAEPKPYVLLHEYADYYIEYKIFYFIRNLEARERIQDEVLTRVWYQLRRDGLSIPFPIHDVNLRRIPEDEEARERERRRERVLAALEKVPFLEPLSKKELATLADRIRSEHYAAGERIIVQGESGDSFYIIADGQVAVRVRHDGHDRTVARLGPHEFFGEFSLMTGEERTATVVAETDVEVFVVDKEAFSSIIQANQRLVEHIAARLAERRQALEAARDDERQAHQRTDAVEVQKTLISKIRRFFQLK